MADKERQAMSKPIVYRLVLALFVAVFCAGAALDGAVAHSPHDIIFRVGLSPNYQEDSTVFIITVPNFGFETITFFRSVDGGASWRSIHNGLDNRYRFSDVVTAPSWAAERTVFLSTVGDGIYKSTDGGDSWTAVNRKLANRDISRLALSSDYANDETITAAGSWGGLYLSTDGGDSWRETIDRETQITAMAFLPGDEGVPILLAGDSSGIVHESRDAGITWQARWELAGGAITAIAASPTFASDGTIYIGTAAAGAYRVVDGTVVDTTVDGTAGIYPLLLPAGEGSSMYITDIALSPDYGRDGAAFIATWKDALFRSTDAGVTWVRYSEGITKNPQADNLRYRHFANVGISSAFHLDGTLFLAAFDGLFKSENQGEDWVKKETLNAGLITGAAVSPVHSRDSTVAVGTYQAGVNLTHNRGVSWRTDNQALDSGRLYRMAFSPDYAKDGMLFSFERTVVRIGSISESEWRKIQYVDPKSVPETERWPYFPAVFPEAVAVSPDFERDGVIYIGTRLAGILQSADRGMTWSRKGLDEASITDLAISPDYGADKTLFAGVLNGGVYRTSDGGVSWEPANEGISIWTDGSRLSTPETHVLSMIRLAISPNFALDHTVFAATGDSLYRSTDRGATWQRLDSSVFGGIVHVVAIALSPAYASDETVLASVKGLGLFKSTDGGDTFVEVGHHLIAENQGLRFIHFSPTYVVDQTIYGVGDHLLQSTDGGEHWRALQQPIRHEEFKDSVHYSGTWTRGRGELFSTSFINHADAPGSVATLEFVGTGIVWIGTQSPKQGIARVTVDGEFQGYVDQYAGKRQILVTSYAIGGLAPGPHTIEIEVTGRRNPDSMGKRIEIDAFDVYP